MSKVLNSSFSKDWAVLCSNLLSASSLLLYNKNIQRPPVKCDKPIQSLCLLVTRRVCICAAWHSQTVGRVTVSICAAALPHPGYHLRLGPFPLARSTAEAGASSKLDFYYSHTVNLYTLYKAHSFDTAVTAWSLVITIKVAPFTVVTFTSLLNHRMTYNYQN